MSNAIYPTLKGLEFTVKKKPFWKTNIFDTASGREYRSTYWTYPRWEIGLSYEFLSQRVPDTDMATLAGFFNQRYGNFDTFLFLDPDDNSNTDAAFGTGDGVTTTFSLARTFGGFREPIGYTNSITNIKVNGSATGAYSVTDNRLIVFNSAPANNAALTWTGIYYYRCRFKDPEMSLEKFMQALWNAKSVTLITDKP